MKLDYVVIKHTLVYVDNKLKQKASITNKSITEIILKDIKKVLISYMLFYIHGK